MTFKCYGIVTYAIFMQTLAAGFNRLCPG